MILDVKPNGGIEFMVRPGTGAATQFLATATVTTPVWLKLTVDNATTVTAWIGEEVDAGCPSDPRRCRSDPGRRRSSAWP